MLLMIKKFKRKSESGKRKNRNGENEYDAKLILWINVDLEKSVLREGGGGDRT